MKWESRVIYMSTSLSSLLLWGCVLLADGGARYWLNKDEWSADSEKMLLRACGPRCPKCGCPPSLQQHSMAPAKHVGQKGTKWAARDWLSNLRGLSRL